MFGLQLRKEFQGKILKGMVAQIAKRKELKEVPRDLSNGYRKIIRARWFVI